MDPKQEISEGTTLEYWWVEGTLQKERQSRLAAFAMSPVGAGALSGDTQGNRRRRFLLQFDFQLQEKLV